MKKKYIFFLFGIMVLPLFVGSMWAVNQLQDVRSKAAEEKIVAIPTVVPAPRTVLSSPYFRLVTVPGKTYVAGDQLPVEIYADTKSKPTSESRFVIVYDSTLLSLDAPGIQNNEVYPVINIEATVPGKAVFSVFMKQESGYTPVTLSKEEKIITLFFRVIGKGKADTDISFVVNSASDETTSMSLFTEDRSSLLQNILSSQEGTTVTIQ